MFTSGSSLVFLALMALLVSSIEMTPIALDDADYDSNSYDNYYGDLGDNEVRAKKVVPTSTNMEPVSYDYETASSDLEEEEQVGDDGYETEDDREPTDRDRNTDDGTRDNVDESTSDGFVIEMTLQETAPQQMAPVELGSKSAELLDDDDEKADSLMPVFLTQQMANGRKPSGIGVQSKHMLLKGLLEQQKRDRFLNAMKQQHQQQQYQTFHERFVRHPVKRFLRPGTGFQRRRFKQPFVFFPQNENTKIYYPDEGMVLPSTKYRISPPIGDSRFGPLVMTPTYGSNANKVVGGVSAGNHPQLQTVQNYGNSRFYGSSAAQRQLPQTFAASNRVTNKGIQALSAMNDANPLFDVTNHQLRTTLTCNKVTWEGLPVGIYACCGQSLYRTASEKCAPGNKVEPLAKDASGRYVLEPDPALFSTTTLYPSQQLVCHSKRYSIPTYDAEFYACCNDRVYFWPKETCQNGQLSSDNLMPPSTPSPNEIKTATALLMCQGNPNWIDARYRRFYGCCGDRPIDTRVERCNEPPYPAPAPSTTCPSGYVCCGDYAPVFDVTGTLSCCPEIGPFDPTTSQCPGTKAFK